MFDHAGFFTFLTILSIKFRKTIVLTAVKNILVLLSYYQTPLEEPIFVWYPIMNTLLPNL